MENAIADFCIGQKNGVNRNNDNDYFDSVDKTPAKGFTKECSLREHSSEIFDFCNLCPIAHSLHTGLIKYWLLESFVSGINND